MSRTMISSLRKELPLVRELPVRLLLAAIICACGLTGCGKKGEPAVAFSIGRAAGENSPMTVVLPAGWSYAASEQGSERLQKYVFSGKGAAYPYLWVLVEKCDASKLQERRTKAAKYSSRAFLSGGELSTEYYDSARGVQWNRNKDEFGNGSVTALRFDKYATTLKFFDNRAHLDEFEPVIVSAIDSMQLHDLEEHVAASIEPVPLPSSVSPDVFHVAAQPAGFPWLLMLFTIAVVGALVRAEHVIRHRRYAEQVAEVEQKIGDRKRQEAALKKSQDAATAAYLRKAPDPQRRRR